MANVSRLHHGDSLSMPLADGATLRVTPFRESPRVAIAFYGPGGGDAGGAVLTAKRARLLASWLLRLADQCGPNAARPGPTPAADPGTLRDAKPRAGGARPPGR